MATATASSATVRRDGNALVFQGALLRGHVAGLWAQARPLRAGAARLDLAGVSRVDSAGLALLAELGAGLPVAGLPDGLAELRAAYRLDPTLDFAR